MGHHNIQAHEVKEEVGINEIFSRLFGKKKPATKQFDGPRFPSPGKEKEWMSSKLDHFKKHHPEHAHHLFSPATADYMPKDVHVGSTEWYRNHEAQKHYSELKKQNPDLVKRAKEHTLKHGHVGMSRVGDYADTHGVTVKEEVDINEESKTWRVVGDHGPQAGDYIEKHIVAKTKEAATASFAKHVEKHYPLQWKRMGHHNIRAHEVKEEVGISESFKKNFVRVLPGTFARSARRAKGNHDPKTNTFIKGKEVIGHIKGKGLRPKYYLKRSLAVRHKALRLEDTDGDQS